MSEENKELDLTPNQQNQIIEKAKKSWVRNPQENFGMENVQSGDNAKYLRHNLLALDLPPIDLDSDEQVLDRIQWYFNHCVEDDMKPTVQGMANALGISRRTLYDWSRGKFRGKTDNRTEIIQKAYGVLAGLWEDYMMNGKINPVSGIFIGKNHFGYTNKQEIVLEPKNPLGDIEETPEDIQQRYLESAAVEDE